MAIRIGLVASAVLVISASCVTITPGDPRLHYVGRHTNYGTFDRFDWVGSGVSLRVAPGKTVGNVSVDMDGGGNRWAVYRNGVIVNDFFASAGYKIRASYSLTDIVGGDVVSLIKATEVGPSLGGPHAVTLFNVLLEGVELASFGEAPSRRIAVYGDSDSASFGVDGKSADTFTCTFRMFHQENFAHGWVSAVTKLLDAEVQVVAESGVGVVKNAMDLGVLSVAATLSTEPMPKLLKRTLESGGPKYDATSWRPSVIVVYIGSNDYVNLFPPSEAAFKTGYVAMMKDILDPFVGHEPPVVHVCGGEAKPCDYIKAIVANTTGAIYTDTGDFGEPKLGCAGHRNAEQQAALATRLSPIIARAAGWSSSEEVRHALLI